MKLRLVTLLLFCLLAGISSYAQNIVGNSYMLHRAYVRPLAFALTDTSNKVQRVQLYTREDLEKAEQMVESGKVLTIVGACLTGSSPILFFPGLPLLAAGIGEDITGLKAAGATLMALGVTNFVVGVPLLTVGAVRWAHWDEKLEKIERNLQIQGTVKANGHVGLVMKF